jgi:hypothetical protein
MRYMMLVKYRGQQYAVCHDEDGFYTVEGTRGDHLTTMQIVEALEEIPRQGIILSKGEDIILRPVG